VIATLVEALVTIAADDFPGRWESLPQALLAGLAAPLGPPLHTALKLIHAVLRRFSRADAEEGARVTLDLLTAALAPSLVQVLEAATPLPTDDAGTAIALCLKCFWACTAYDTTGVFSNVGFVARWWAAVAAVRARPVPAAALAVPPAMAAAGGPVVGPASHDPRARWPVWRVVKWATKIATRWVARYGFPAYTLDRCVAVGRTFMTRALPALLAGAVDVLRAFASGTVWVADRVVLYALNLVEEASASGPSWRALTPHMAWIFEQLLAGRVFRFTPDDEEAWLDGPAGFFHNAYERKIEDGVDPRLAGINLISAVCRKRREVLPSVVELLQRGFLAARTALAAHVDAAVAALGGAGAAAATAAAARGSLGVLEGRADAMQAVQAVNGLMHFFGALTVRG
jgi:hypothetical protein